MLKLALLSSSLLGLGLMAFSATSSTPIPPPSCTQAELDLNINNLYAANIAHQNVLDAEVDQLVSKARRGTITEKDVDLGNRDFYRSQSLTNLVGAAWDVEECFETDQ